MFPNILPAVLFHVRTSTFTTKSHTNLHITHWKKKNMVSLKLLFLGIIQNNTLKKVKSRKIMTSFQIFWFIFLPLFY